jgi:hypothetical protein
MGRARSSPSWEDVHVKEGTILIRRVVLPIDRSDLKTIAFTLLKTMRSRRNIQLLTYALEDPAVDAGRSRIGCLSLDTFKQGLRARRATVCSHVRMCPRRRVKATDGGHPLLHKTILSSPTC